MTVFSSHRAFKGDVGVCALATQHTVLRDAKVDFLRSDPLSHILAVAATGTRSQEAEGDFPGLCRVSKCGSQLKNSLQLQNAESPLKYHGSDCGGF